MHYVRYTYTHKSSKTGKKPMGLGKEPVLRGHFMAFKCPLPEPKLSHALLKLIF